MFYILYGSKHLAICASLQPQPALLQSIQQHDEHKSPMCVQMLQCAVPMPDFESDMYVRARTSVPHRSLRSPLHLHTYRILPPSSIASGIRFGSVPITLCSWPTACTKTKQRATACPRLSSASYLRWLPPAPIRAKSASVSQGSALTSSCRCLDHPAPLPTCSQ